MGLYTPFQLIHAHLPLHSFEGSVVQEVAVPSERAFPQDDEVYTSPLLPDHAVSVSLEPSTATLARVVYNGYALELSSLSTVISTKVPASGPVMIRILFPDPIIPLCRSCIVLTSHGSTLVVIAITQANEIYRFNFPLEGVADASTRIDFLTKGNDWVEKWEIPYDILSATGGFSSWTLVNEDTVVFGGRDGGIVKATRSPRSTSEYPVWGATHHRAVSRLRIGSLFSRSTDDQIVSVAEFRYQDQIQLLYTFSRDAKLRTWSYATGQCLKTVDVNASSSLDVTTRLSPSDSSSSRKTPSVNDASLIRVIPHPNPSSRYSHLIVVFVHTQQDLSVPGTFVFYRVSQTTHGTNEIIYAGKRIGSPSTTASELRSFEVLFSSRTGSDEWRLWTVWDSKGTIFVECVPIDDILQFNTYLEPPQSDWTIQWQRVKIDADVERLDAAYFDNLLGLHPPDAANINDTSDISKTFVSHLFKPGRFSTLTLTTALDEYIGQLPRGYQDDISSTVYLSLSNKFAAVVGISIKMETSPQTGAPQIAGFRKSLKLDWLGIWARAREIDKQSRWPVATVCVDDQLLILDREGGSVPLYEDAAEALVRLSLCDADMTDFLKLPYTAMKKSYSVFAPQQMRGAMAALASAGARLSALLADHTAENSESALNTFTNAINSELSTGSQSPIEDLGGALWEETVNPYLSSEDCLRIRSALAESVSVTQTISNILDLLSSHASSPAPLNHIPELSYAGFGNALLAATISAVIEARYLLARNVVLMALFYLSESANDTEDNTSEELIIVSTRALVTFHRLRVLRWLADHTGDEASERAIARRLSKRKLMANDDILSDFGNLKMLESEDDHSFDTDGFNTKYSLFHSLFGGVMPQEVMPGGLASIIDAATRFLAEYRLFEKDQVDIEPRGPDLKLANAVLVNGSPTIAVQLTELYPPSSGMAYVKGRGLIEMGVIEGGVESLERASIGCKDGSLITILPSCNGSKGFAVYYRHIMSLADGHGLEGPVARFGELALQSSDPLDSSTKDIYSRVFLAYLALGQYESAYSTLTSSPFRETKRDMLGQLISVMCEANEVGRLNALGFIGFQKDVEERLNFKARNSDPLRFPNYYKVLYSWHISRGDYRSAAEIMYVQGRRFVESNRSKMLPFELSAMQARSYLAAINTLSLVEPRNAWFCGTIDSNPSMRDECRKTDSYIPNDEVTENEVIPYIITLKDIQAEYMSVISQLHLASHVPDLHGHGVSLSPKELVGFFTQRGLFDLAQSTASSLSVDMTDLFQALAVRCVELSRVSTIASDNAAASFLLTSHVTSRLRGPPFALALRYLQVALTRHDSSSTQFRYRAIVAETFFALNQDQRCGWQMPVWLVEWEMSRDPEGWIQRALSHGWIEEAIRWTADLVKTATPPELLSRVKSSVSELPYNLIDRVLAASSEEGDHLQQMSELLRVEVERKVARLRSMAP